MAQLAAASLAPPPPGWSGGDLHVPLWQASAAEEGDGAAMESSLAEQTFPTWEREQIIGRGGFGTVYLGTIQETGQQMAVKTILIQGMNTKELRNIENEIRMIRDLRHRHIVRYLGMEKTATDLNIFLEYAAGGSLRQLLQEKGGLSEEETSRYTYQILQGLHYLHSNEKTHRDIKGANVLLSAEGFCKLADFGACKHVEATSYVSGLKGTPHWMAPEVIRGEQGSGWQKADIWSVGCTVIEMLTGQAPWPDLPNPIAALYRIAHGDSPPIHVDVSPEAREFIRLCCQQDASSRPTASWLMENSEFLRRHNSSFPSADSHGLGRPPSPMHQRQDSSLTREAGPRELCDVDAFTVSPQSQVDSLRSNEDLVAPRAFFDDQRAPRVVPVQSEEPLIGRRGRVRPRPGGGSPAEQGLVTDFEPQPLARDLRVPVQPAPGSSEEELPKAPRWTQRAVATEHMNIVPMPVSITSMVPGSDRPLGAHGRRDFALGSIVARDSPHASPATSPRWTKGRDEVRRRNSKHKRDRAKEKLDVDSPLGERPSAPPTGEHLGLNGKHRDDSRVRLRMAEVRNAAKRESTEMEMPSPNPRRLVKSAGSVGKLPPLHGRAVATAPSSSTMHASLQFEQAEAAEATPMRNSMPAAVHSSPAKPSRKKKSKHPL